MKTRIAAAIFAVAAMLTPACEQHSWKDASQFFKPHGDHGHGHGHDDHGSHKGDAHGHAADKAHGHGDKKAH